jgi:SOS-response transcriptional repressor LexA
MKIDVSKILHTIDVSYGGNQSEFAKANSISESTLSQVLSGVSKRIQKKTLNKICKALNCTINEILILDRTGVKMVKGKNVAGGVFSETTRQIPLLGRITACWPVDQGEVIEMVPVSAYLWRDNRYVLEVDGDSMSPVYQDGDKILIDHYGDVQLADAQNRACAIELNGKTCLKVVRVKWNDSGPDKISLVSLNEKFSQINIGKSDDFHVLGIAKEIVYRRTPKIY